MFIKQDSVIIKVVSNSNVHHPGDGYQKDVSPYTGILETKKNKIMIHVTTWKNLKNSLASESSHMQKTAYCVISIICNVQKMEI